ncbi:HlyD family secretion protein (plasmid) [Pseudoalteromonas xiamenensis]|uniref:HlyD family secretion protein n=1 Tax=Pseudoalteromonas xiamenensis TaxID=882626 RepID=UPI0027E4EEFB|nr:HlyD family secretion protein [Pseudoalteromonas xiamenensis]WMN61665.1 HlyD family secretion protein [Pseudoalteromonas xiamenensis]
MIKHKVFSSLKILITISSVLLASYVVWNLYTYYHYAPQTRDGRIRADIVALAADISGTVDTVHVHDNQTVRKGTLLFSLDKKRLKSEIKQAEAMVKQAEVILQAADREYKRYLRLNSAVSEQLLEDKHDERILAQASLEKCLADLELVEINLSRADIYSPVDGVITNFSLRPGSFAAAGVPVMALIDLNSFYVSGYFEETKLSRIQNGAAATIFVMGESQPIYGHVEGLSAGINDRERTTATGTLLANVNSTFSWIRLAQRIPVRIKIDIMPKEFALIAGRTVSVSLEESH